MKNPFKKGPDSSSRTMTSAPPPDANKGEDAPPNYDLLTNGELTRTDLYCNECRKDFVAMLAFNLDGNHKVRCPHCGHIHWRVIAGGRVTGDRWNGAAGQVWEIGTQHVWASAVAPMATSTASAYLRDLWLRRDE